MSLHQHFALIQKLSQRLNSVLPGMRMTDAFAENETLLTLVFSDENESFTIQLNLESRQCLFLFFDEIRSRTSGVQPKFKTSYEVVVIEVKQHEWNRSFELQFENGARLVFKLYGPLSNVILCSEGNKNECFRESIEADYELLPDALNQPSNEMLFELLEKVQTATKYYVLQNTIQPCEFSLDVEVVEGYKVVFDSFELLDAFNHFSKAVLTKYRFDQKYQGLLQGLKASIDKQERIIASNERRLKYHEKAASAEEIGHIIMANMHLISKGMTSITLHDFYRDEPIQIKLKKELNAQENGAVYYRKARNQNKEVETATIQLKLAQTKLVQLNAKLQELQKVTDFSQFRRFESAKVQEQVKTNQFKVFELEEGYKVYVGKDAVNNDQLTLKFAHKEDLWFHAKDIAGSHVVLQRKGKMNFPNWAIESAASIAAYYSKNRAAKLVPVTYTLKKYVRKPKGEKPGSVKVEREEVVLVEPKLP